MPEIKRLRYFDKQFLKEPDFTDEQRYHLGMRRRHNRLLHTPGIAEGLEVQKTAARIMTVSAGTAIDRNGQEIVLSDPVVLSLDDPAVISPAPGPNVTLFVTIAYNEVATDPQPVENPLGNTRTTERPLLKVTPQPPDTTVISLATFKLDTTAPGNVPGNVNDKLDGGVRTFVGAVLADNAVSISKLKKELRLGMTITLPAGATQDFIAFKAPANTPTSAFLLVYAFSPPDNTNPAQTTPVALTDTGSRGFTWDQRYYTGIIQPDTAIHTYQLVRLRNLGTVAIAVSFRVYAVLEN